MNCRTPGCNTAFSDNDTERRYCERCGWPLAQGMVTCLSESVACQGNLPVTLKVRVDNRGAGRLKWAVQEVPRGVTVADEPLEVPAQAHGLATLCIDPTQLCDEQLDLTVRLWDKVGGSSQDLRPPGRDECWRDENLHLPVRRQQFGPMDTAWKTLVFGGSVRSVAARVDNHGEAELLVRARVTDGYSLTAPGQPKASQLEASVLGRTGWTVTVKAEAGAPLRPGELVFETDYLPQCSVALFPVDLKPVPPPPERWVVAIDFGTTKSAVAVLDQFCLGAEPKLVRWPRKDETEPELWLPSVVEITTQGRPGRFGWEIPYTETGATIYRSLKMRLRENDEAVRKCIVYFLRRLLERTAAEFEGVFEDARVVFTLPVLDNAELYEEQRRRTLEYALEAGRVFDLSADRIDFYKEPECAAVDFLHGLMHKPGGGTLGNGAWLCVLDMGGGTTDVTFARLNVLTNGTPSFEELHSYGYENHAGDRVDLEFYGFAIDQWLAKGRLKGVQGQQKPPKELDPDTILGAPSLQLEGEKVPYGRPANLNTLNFLKEKMYSSEPPQNQRWEEFSKADNTILLVPKDLEMVLGPLAHRIFIEGIRSDGHVIPSVRTALEDLGLTPNKIAFLCLTGGTCLIPDFQKLLREWVLYFTSMRTLVDKESIRLNVVLGAVRRPGVRVHGTLPCALTLIVTPVDGRAESAGALPLGSVPGAEKSISRWIRRGDTVTVGLRADFPEQPSMLLFEVPVHYDQGVSDYAGQLSLKARISYGPKGLVRMHLAWDTKEPLPEPLPALAVQALPSI